MAEFVGGFIDPAVITQLQKRADIYKKKTGRTPEDLNFMNSRNAWVRVISSVDVINPVNFSVGTGITFDSTDSKNYVLSNLSSIKGTGESLSYTTNSGIDFNKKNSDTAYQYSEDTGVRPKPGITSFAVTTKGRFGTIREANVSFTVWSRDDLDAVERVYFRPGYSCIIEWGHTIYVDNGGTVQTDLSGFNANLKDYFDSTKTFNSILSKLSQNTKDKFGNYQSFVGFVKNFNWSFRNDGGYDCSISVISQGEILESLKMTFDNAGTPVESSQKNSKYENNFIYKFLGILRSNKADTPIKGSISQLVGTTDLTVQSQDIKDIYEKIPGPVSRSGFKPVATKQYALNTGPGYSQTYYYFPLRTLIYLLNEGFGIVGKDCQKIAEIDTLSQQQYFTFKDHFSSDPLTCVIPNKKIVLKSKIYTVEFDTTSGVFIRLIERTGGRNEDRGKKILDLLITDVLVERALENKPESITAFLNYILSEITDALGGVNDFIIQEVEDSLKLEIKDMALVPDNETDELVNKKVEIPLSGIQGILTDLKIQSKISKDLASMIAIAAQAGPGRSAEDTYLLTQWNAGLQDRFAGSKNQGSFECGRNQQTPPPSPPPSSTFSWYLLPPFILGYVVIQLAKKIYNSFTNKDAEKTFLELAAQAYYLLFDNSTAASYDAPLFETVKQKGLTYFKNITGRSYLPEEGKEQDQSSAKNTVAKGVIPVELSFKTDGIGGFKKGQAFKVSPGILPAKYDEFGYIITGIDHSIENNRWYTDIKSQLFIIPGKAKQGNVEIETQELVERTVPQEPIFNNNPEQPFLPGQVEDASNEGSVMRVTPVPDTLTLTSPVNEQTNQKYREFIKNFAVAIAQQEGFFVPGNLADRQNNPGNLRNWGNTPILNKFVNFPTLEEGWNALYRQANLNIQQRRLTFLEFFAGKPGVYDGYAPSADNNDPLKYAQFVAEKVGTSNINEKIFDYFIRISR